MSRWKKVFRRSVHVSALPASVVTVDLTADTGGTDGDPVLVIAPGTSRYQRQSARIRSRAVRRSRPAPPRPERTQGDTLYQRRSARLPRS